MNELTELEQRAKAAYERERMEQEKQYDDSFEIMHNYLTGMGLPGEKIRRVQGGDAVVMGVRMYWHVDAPIAYIDSTAVTSLGKLWQARQAVRNSCLVKKGHREDEAFKKRDDAIGIIDIHENIEDPFDAHVMLLADIGRLLARLVAVLEVGGDA